MKRSVSMPKSKLSTQRLAADCAYVAVPATDEARQKADGSPKFPRDLYPPIEPDSHELLPVGDGHSIYVEQCGNPDGPAALFLHGGPGGGCSPRSRRFFDPAYWRIICLDQRGCGRSTPNAADDWEASIFENNTQKIVQDLEVIRNHLDVEQVSPRESESERDGEGAGRSCEVRP